MAISQFPRSFEANAVHFPSGDVVASGTTSPESLNPSAPSADVISRPSKNRGLSSKNAGDSSGTRVAPSATSASQRWFSEKATAAKNATVTSVATTRGLDGFTAGGSSSRRQIIHKTSTSPTLGKA